MEALDFEEPTPADHGTSVGVDCPVYLWPSRVIFLTDLLFSSPQLRFSEAQKRAILSWAHEMGATSVPTLSSLKKAQQSILNDSGDPTRKVAATDGSVFYINDVSKALASDYSNPLTRSRMEDYPIFTSSSMSQVWNGTKMLLELPADLATPTARNASKIFWINKLTQLLDRSYFVPSRYFRLQDPHNPEKRDLMAFGWTVERHANGFHVLDGSGDPSVDVSVSRFYRTFDEICSEEEEYGVGFNEEYASYAAKMPHPFHASTGNKMVYSVPLILFEDDVSGNISKQWNKHYIIY
ncbi:hypothetical protein M407DRAFT_29269 [Tulasnella calospora MUT 4182]|uniref:Uncharacterized protein n=1 Tax=Tulasnella calospora MUT 4182 TaxID=1051891 RepID=A0A0C3QAE8_9AGAM|nr:hypothetical protein M407DRAFT_29269 [Tulasnella calospora MUT 4182]